RLRHDGFVSWLQFTPDGKTLVSQGRDGVRLWKAATGEQLRHFPNERDGQQMPTRGAALSRDGKLLAVPGKSDVHVYEVATGKRVGILPTGRVNCVRFAPDGKTMAVHKDVR